MGWLNDTPRAVFQRRQLVLLEDAGAVVVVTAWQDIVRVDLLKETLRFRQSAKPLPVGSYSLGSPADAAGMDEPFVLQLSQHESNGLVAHSGHRPPQVCHLERCSGVVEHVVPHPVLLGDGSFWKR